MAILMPHIDFRVAPAVYGPGFAPLQDHDADLVIMVGTSHYWADDAFILTEKDFTTPLGIVKTDVDLVRALSESLPGVAKTDIAHRPEHSLELHLVGLQLQTYQMELQGVLRTMGDVRFGHARQRF